MIESEKYYILGLFYADGSYREIPRFRLTLALHNKDIVLLKAVAALLNEKVLAKTSTCSYFTIHGKQKTSLWNNLGITVRKTYQVDSKIFDNIPNIFKKDFIRGLFDGDGSISGNRFCITGLNNVLFEAIKQYIEIELKIILNVRKEMLKHNQGRSWICF